MQNNKLYKLKNKTILVAVFAIYFSIIMIFSFKAVIDQVLKKNIYKGRTSRNILLKADHGLSLMLFNNSGSETGNDYFNFYMDVTASNTIFNHFSSRMNSYYKLVFEIEFNDGTKKIVLPEVGCVETGLRLNNLYSAIVTTNNELYRDVLLKRMTEYECERFYNVKKITAAIGEVVTPSPAEFEAGHGFYFKNFCQYVFTNNQ